MGQNSFLCQQQVQNHNDFLKINNLTEDEGQQSEDDNVKISTSYSNVRSDDNVTFLREAFGARTCCTMQSWALVFAFAHMVYSCCLFGLLAMTVVLLLLSSHNNTEEQHHRVPSYYSRRHGSLEKTLLILAVVYFLLQICIAVFTSKIFGVVAQLRSNFALKLRQLLTMFFLLKGTSLAILVTFCVLNEYGELQDNKDDWTNEQSTSTDKTLGIAFTSCDTAFSLLYALVLALFIMGQRESGGCCGGGKMGEGGVVVMKVTK